ncbi:MAG: transglutaminase domain-containing protein, partial [Bacteroidales bacterium]|nr:transglutaminase domain-containing protein [Bacteroidales bacterium]
MHEGSVIEFACILTLEEEALYALIPWEFQKEIPVVFSSFTFSYPEFFRYKNFISGNPRLVKFSSSTKRQYLEGREYDVITSSWYAQNVPALISEPYSKGLSENQTVLTFELGSVEYFGTRTQEITPTYKTLNEKLLKRDDFGLALSRTDFLNREVKNITKGLNDDLSKLKAIHSYLSKKILWNGIKDYTSSGPLRKVFYREKGNSADINMILIAMLRSAGIRADPVILSTRSNGTISQISAMVQQYNYLVARVVAGGEIYLVDATEPLSPFNLLPFDCLNGKG